MVLLSILIDLDGVKSKAAPKSPPRSSWSKFGLLGNGLFGQIWRTRQQKSVVCNKEVPLANHGSKAKQAFMQLEHEIAMLAQIEHVNIVGTQMENDKLYFLPKLMTRDHWHQWQGIIGINDKQFYEFPFKHIQILDSNCNP